MNFLFYTAENVEYMFYYIDAYGSEAKVHQYLNKQAPWYLPAGLVFAVSVKFNGCTG
jgi:hypothetical protein